MRPQDYLANHMGLAGPPAMFPRRKAGKPRSARKPAARPDVLRKPAESQQTRRKPDGKSPVMGEVTILRRGESLPEEAIRGLHSPRTPAPASAADDLALRGRSGPADPYAGSACATSPPPSELPLPSLWKKKAASRIVDELATRDLRRLLRLDD